MKNRTEVFQAPNMSESDDKFSLAKDPPSKTKQSSTTKSCLIYIVPAVLVVVVLLILPFLWYNLSPKNDANIVVIEFEKFAYGQPREHHDHHSKNYWVFAFFETKLQDSEKAEETKPAESIDNNSTSTTKNSSTLEPRSHYKTKREVNEKCGIIEEQRFDCHPEEYATKEKCEARGCCWHESQLTGVPLCFYPLKYPTYELINDSSTADGFTAYFKFVGKAYYPNPVKLLRIDVKATTTQQANLKIYDPLNPRFEVPYIKNTDKSVVRFEDTDFEVSVTHPFNLIIKQKSTGKNLFDPNFLGGFIYTDQLIQISQPLPSKHIYGLGERRDNFLSSVNWKRYIMFAADQSPRDDSNLYGSHPFYLALTENGDAAFGQVLLNSNAMEVILQPAPAITYRTLGGILDFQLFVGNNPNEIVSEYMKFVGLPSLPPYWSLGFHLCRWGYESSKVTRETWQAMRDSGIPFDVQWNDIDYMDHQRDFTYDKNNFHDLPELVQDIHDAGMHYVVIVDPGIDTTSVNKSYPPYDDGVKQDIFIKNHKGEIFKGKVWSDNGAVYPDFTLPKTTNYWTDQLQKLYKEIPYDGLWIDMNEPSNFLNGEKDGCPDLPYENPPYIPDVNGGMLQHKTLCMTAKQHLSEHYNVHNLYGFTEAIATNAALKTIRNKRPFIISRSSFPGHGHYAGHWSGDNFATWSDMQKSIPAILDFNMFGIPMMGADICGFNDDSEKQLCQRWMEVGAFYPFSRNHNTIKTIPQDPVSMGPDVVESSKKALQLRYLFLPHLYTLFYRATKYGETVVRPLVFEFPQDSATYGIDSQFLWGSSMMILPVLEKDVTQITPYFPKGKWYLAKDFQTIDSTGQTVKLDAPLDTIHVAFRGGAILPVHQAKNTTTESRKAEFGLLVALDENENAKGELFWDDGDSLDVMEKEKYISLKFVATKGKMNSTVDRWGVKDEVTLGIIAVLGVSKAPDQVTVNDEAHQFTYSYDSKSLLIQAEVSFDQTINVSWK